MEENKEKYYTTGEFAKKAGVTIRTIRYYDNKGILKPTCRDENDYRLYKENDFAKLQRVLTLKYLGFPLDEIGQAVNYPVGKEELISSLDEQKSILEDRVIHMKSVIRAIEEAQNIINEKEKFPWDSCIKIIDAINTGEEVLQQYKNSSNLRARISIHDEYSTNKYGWHKWLFDNIEIPPNAKILEIGSGDGTLWAKNIKRLPQDCKVFLSDISEGMIKDARKNLSNYKDRFEFIKMDGNSISFENESFDIVIANHMLYYLKDRKIFLKEVRRVLKNSGQFYTSTIGDNHMKELKDLARDYDEKIDIEKVKFSDIFGLESGKDQLEEFFKEVKLYNYKDSLIVNNPKAIIDYLYSTHGNLQEVIKNKEMDFEKFIKDRVEDKKEIFISKYSGLFVCRK